MVTSQPTECPTCGRDGFETRHSMKIHHARSHGESIAGVDVECSWCGEEHSRTPANAEESENHFCSKQCYTAHQRDNWQGSGHPRYSRVGVECAHCGERTEKKKCHAERFKNNFCDMTCKNRWMAKQREDSVTHGSESEMVECANCEAHFLRKPSLINRSKRQYCSTECKQGHLVGPRAPGYRGGGGDIYGPGWNETKKKAVRRRDGWVCQDCGMSAIQHQMKNGQRLHVHHITPARDIDDPVERNSVDNLVALCRGCHMNREHSSEAPISDHTDTRTTTD